METVLLSTWIENVALVTSLRGNETLSVLFPCNGYCILTAQQAYSMALELIELPEVYVHLTTDEALDLSAVLSAHAERLAPSSSFPPPGTTAPGFDCAVATGCRAVTFLNLSAGDPQ